MSRTRLKDVVKQQKSSLKLSDLKKHGAFPVFGASGLVGYRDCFQSEKEAVAIIKDGAGIGRVSMLPKHSSVLGTMQMLEPKEGISNSYLFYYLSHLKLGKSFTGSTIPHIYFKNYSDSSFPDVSYNQQCQVAEKLDAIRKSIEQKNNQLSVLDSLVKSRFMEMFGNPISNDKNWPTSTIENCCYMKGLKTIPQKEKYWLLNLDKIESNTGEIIKKDYVTIDEIGNSTFFFDKDYVLYSKLRPYLNKVVVPNESGFGTSELVPLKPNSFVDIVYLAHLLRSESFVKWIDSTSSGAKMPRASVEALRSFTLPLPPIELQNQFADFVHLIDKSRFVVHSRYFL